MPDKPFDRCLIGYREKPISDDHNRNQSQDARTLLYALGQVLGGRASNASEALGQQDTFFGQGLRVRPESPVALGVRVSAGLGLHYLPADAASSIGVPDLIGVDDLAEIKPILLSADHQFAVPTAPGVPNTRIDIVEVRADRYLTDSESRRQFNDASGAFDPHNFYKTLSFQLDGRVETINAPANATQPLAYKVGVAANPGTVPATSPGYIKIAEILVGTSVTTIDNNVIVDRRKLAGPSGVVHASLCYRQQYNAGAPIVTVLHATMPPGVRYGINASASERGAARLYFAGGEITHAVVRPSIRHRTYVVNGVEALVPVILPLGLSADFVLTVDSTYQTEMLAAEVPVSVGIGSKFVGLEVGGRYIVDSGAGPPDVNNTNGSLEDVIVDVAIDLAYHT